MYIYINQSDRAFALSFYGGLLMKITLNHDIQYYKGIKLQLIKRSYPRNNKAKRFTIGGTNQNVWIPNKHLEPNGIIIDGMDIDYVFRRAQRQLELAGYTDPIIGIKRRSVTN
jgi:hypothetical protein